MAAFSETDLIDNGFDTQFQQIFKIFFDAYAAAQGNDAAQQAAVDHFQRGVRTARAVREAAKRNLP